MSQHGDNLAALVSILSIITSGKKVSLYWHIPLQTRVLDEPPIQAALVFPCIPQSSLVHQEGKH
jgi:hypothetical protein